LAALRRRPDGTTRSVEVKVTRGSVIQQNGSIRKP
jgi:hypothetical protein